VMKLTRILTAFAALLIFWNVNATPTFTVSDGRVVRIFPAGPSYEPIDAWSRRFLYAAGLGAGRVITDCVNSRRFFCTVVSNLTAATLQVSAHGYKVGESDPTINNYGNDSPLSQVYVYQDEIRDSYLYGWQTYSMVESTGEIASCSEFNHVLERSAAGAVPITISLPTEKSEVDDKYPCTIVNVVFSKEWLPSDNTGDINCDGIPDIYRTFYSLTDPDQDVDLASLGRVNDDEDYLPQKSNPNSSLIPSLQPLWFESFTAMLEIRGYGEALNDAPQLAGLTGVCPDRRYTDPRSDPSSTLSPLEYMAWTDYTNEHTTAAVDDWSPERPSDPTKADTDGDGIDDGTEYWWWYRAHVGYIDANGAHLYAEGRRYDPRNPGSGRLIAREEIERVMDPLVAGLDRTVDSDNDGLPDLIEVQLGTNPFDFDSDDDGLPDGYEIMLCGTDPLRAYTDPNIRDSLRNFDGDAMAFATPALECRVLPAPTNVCEWTTFSVLAVNGDSDGVQWYATRDFPSVDYLVATQLVKVLETPSGRVCTTEPVRVSEDGMLLSSLSRGSAVNPVTFTLADTEPLKGRFPALADCSVPYLRLEPVSVAPGVQLQKIAGDAYVIETTVATLSFDSFWVGCNSAWIYGRPQQDDDAFGMLTLGRYLDVPKGAVLSSLPETSRQVALLHYLVYQEFGFDPRTAWNPNTRLSSHWMTGVDDGSVLAPSPNSMGVSTRTRPYTAYDEFLLLSFFLNNGALHDSDVTPTSVPKKSWASIWSAYTTNPRGPGDQGDSLDANHYNYIGNVNGADTDGDGVPDGWELYVMGGPKDERTGRFVFAAPYGDGVRSSHGPFLPNAGRAQYDTDEDRLTELQEYAGLDSCAYYSEPQEGEKVAYSTTIGSVGQVSCCEKYYPTDPWRANAGDVGVLDGGYLLECDGKWWGVEVKNGEALVCGCYEDDRGALAVGDVRVPSEIGGRPVTGISASAFSGNFGLMSVAIPASVREIEEGAFAWCDVGLSVDAGNGFFRVEQGALLTIDGKILLYWPPDRRIGIPDGVCRIGFAAFAGNRSSRGMSISIPSSVVSIGANAFACVGLLEVDFGEGLAAIEDGAFACNDFNACVLPGSLQNIGDYAFSCTNLVSVTFEGNMPTNVSELAFCWHPAGTSLTFYAYDDTVWSPGGPAGWWLFWGSLVFISRGYTISFESECGGPVVPVVRKRGEAYGSLPVLSAEGRRFIGWCREPNGGVSVGSEELVQGDETLYAHWAISTIADGYMWSYELLDGGDARLFPMPVSGLLNIPADLDGHPVQNIPDACFAHSSNLVSVVISDSVTNIGAYAFYNCSGMTDVMIGRDVTNVGGSAFCGCSSLAVIYVDKGDAERVKSLYSWPTNVTFIEFVAPIVAGDMNATVSGNAEMGFVINPSVGKSTVEITIPPGVDAAKVTVELSPEVERVTPHGAAVRIVRGINDITGFIDIPAADGNGVIDLTKATVKEEIVKEAMDVEQGAAIELNGMNPSLTTPNTRKGLVYKLREGTTLEGMHDGDSKLGDGQPWTPSITVKGGTSGFYTISVEK